MALLGYRFRTNGWIEDKRHGKIWKPVEGVPIRIEIGEYELRVFSYWPAPYRWKLNRFQYRGGTGLLVSMYQYGLFSLSRVDRRSRK